MSKKTTKATRPVRRVVTEHYEEPEDAGEVPDDMPIEDTEDYQVQNILDSVGPGDIKIKILKYGPKGKSYCFSLDGGPVDEDFIQSQYGGGRYQGQIFRNGMYTGRSFELNIAEKVAALGNPATGPSVIELQMKMAEQQNQFLRELLLARNSGPQSSLGELAAALQTLHAMNGGSAGDKAMDLFLKGVELGRAGGDKDSWPELIKDAMPLLEGFLMKRQANGTGGNVSPSTSPGLPPAALPEDTTLQTERLRAVIAYLKQKATLGVDPSYFVDWVAMNAEQPEYQQVIRFVLASDFSQFAAIDQEIGRPPLVGFFRELYDGLRREFGGQDSVAMDTAGRAGDAGNTPDHGAVSEVRKSKSK